MFTGILLFFMAIIMIALVVCIVHNSELHGVRTRLRRDIARYAEELAHERSIVAGYKARVTGLQEKLALRTGVISSLESRLGDRQAALAKILICCRKELGSDAIESGKQAGESASGKADGEQPRQESPAS